MKYWFDTEFYEDGRTIDLISIGVAAEDGREYYAESFYAEGLASKSDWLKQNVLPHLQSPVRLLRRHMAQEIKEFMGQGPEIWAYYADYDWVALCQLFGRMIDLPEGWPMYCRDLKQLADDRGLVLPVQPTPEHHALNDARWTKEAWEFVMQPKVGKGWPR